MEELMYRVIEMYGDCEPWWFLEGWEEDIVSSRKFEDYYQALKYYKQKWLELNAHFPSYKSRSDLMTIFRDTKEQEWCEDCSDDVQFFHSIVLLEDEHKIPKSKLRPGYEKEKGSRKHRSCQYTLDSKKGTTLS